MTGSTPLVVDRYRNNGELIQTVTRLGFLDPGLPTLDPTFGPGGFWLPGSAPVQLVGTDLDPARAVDAVADFRHLPFRDGAFGQAVYDPGYKLNGTPSGQMDDRYGVGQAQTWQDRIELMLAGLAEVCRVVDRHRLGRRRPPARVLVKCKDQVVSQKIRWQTRLLTEVGEEHGFGLEVRFDFLAYRPQPEGAWKQHTPETCPGRPCSADCDHREWRERPQKHPRANASHLLVLRKGWTWRP